MSNASKSVYGDFISLSIQWSFSSGLKQISNFSGEFLELLIFAADRSR